jgi:hypothetical protein
MKSLMYFLVDLLALVGDVDMARNIYYHTMFGHISIETTKHLQNLEIF